MTVLEKVSSAKILIVEDERIVAMDISASLRALKYDVAGIASAGDEAIEKAVDTRPDLILMDIRLKGEIDGITAAGKINEVLDIPVIYLTAYADDNTLARAKLTEPYGYLLKPYEKRVLHSTIEMALYKKNIEKRLKENERWLSTILRSIGDAIIATDEKNQIIFLNPVAEQLTGWKQDEALGKDLNYIFTILDDKHDKVDIPYETTITDNREALLFSKMGKNIDVEFNITPIRKDNAEKTGLVVVFRDISLQKKNELERGKLFNQISEAQERLKILSKRLLEVQEAEKRNLARELHDEVGQILTAIKINIQTIFRLPHNKEIDFHLQESVDLVDSVLNQVRTLSLDLRPSMLDDLGLVPALRWYVDRQAIRSNLTAKVIAGGISSRFNPDIEITCFRIVQEAITNVIRHSGATEIEVTLTQESNLLRLIVRDNGKGFNYYQAIKSAVKGKSVGLLGMQERVELIGGTLFIESGESGTKITATFSI